jgi:type IV pilus assembly protein PilY1
MISGSSGDAEEGESAAGEVNLVSDDLDLQWGVLVGLRFQEVQVPQGATITSAYIEFTPEHSDSGSFSQTIYGEDSDNASAFQEVTQNISGRTRTSAFVAWSSDTPWGDHSERHKTSDISSIVQEIVNRSGWVQGNSMVFIFEPHSGERDAETYEHYASGAPLLHIEYGSAATPHIISASAGYGGTISPSGPVPVSDGHDQSFSIIPDPSNTVEDVIVDGISKGSVNSWTFTNVVSSHEILALFDLPADCSDLASVPLGSLIHTGTPNIMFVLDDSGTMDFEFMTEENDGRFKNFKYVFDDPGDNVYDNSGVLSGRDRGKWKSQWSGYNKIYYDPSVDYQPWPTVAGLEAPADTSTPRSHPMVDGNLFDLSDTYYSFAAGQVIVDDLDSGFSKTGDWTAILNHHESYLNHFWESSSYSILHTALWVPGLAPGEYNVYAWWRSLDEYSTATPYTINHAAGSTMVTKNQRINEDQWNRLGDTSYIFTGNPAVENVTISYTPSGLGGDKVCADAVRFVPAGATVIDIKNAHYYVWSAQEAKPYLIIVDGGQITYYAVAVAGTGADEAITSLTLTTTPPDDVIPKKASGEARTYAEERQNFANWYSFYRRRELAATAAVANVIANMQGVNIGLCSINHQLIQPVLKVKVGGENETATLLNSLYSLTIGDHSTTPLRRGLRAVGRYFHEDDGQDGGIGSSPYASAAQGGACQQAFAVIMTDGYWNGSSPYVGNTDIDDPSGDPNSTFDGPPYGDAYSDTLADVAMHYYERDLSGSLQDLVPTNAWDKATHQHMVTYAVAFGVSGTLTPNDYDEDLKHKQTGQLIQWPNPGDGNQQKIDDLWHATVNGRGEFHSSTNPEELVASLSAIVENIELRTGSSSSVSLNGEGVFGGTDIYLFQSSYSTDGWIGDVKAFAVNTTTGEVASEPVWSAADELEDVGLLWNTRPMVTYDNENGVGIPFRYDNLTLTQQSQLNSDETTAQNILNFLRGDATNEEQNGGAFRERYGKLGDVVHSSPVYENGVLYVGANDGMLHAFDAGDGTELFAYVPNLVFENLSALADPLYHDDHQFYVDLSPAIMSGKGLLGGDAIRTVLVGGLRRGGKGYYALNISDFSPTTSEIEAQLAGRVLWEYPRSITQSAETLDLGYSYSMPAIVDSNQGCPQGAQYCDHYWIVLFGNGYNSESSKAVLYILRPDGTLLTKIDTGVGSCNGLSTPVPVDVNYDYRVDYVYAGDLKGNMWKFDLTSEDYTDWDVAYNDGSNPQPLFQAPGQPITTKPDVMRHPEKHGYLVIFGTGKYLGSSDFIDTSLNTIYGIWDYGDDDDDTEYLGYFDRGSATNKLSNQPATVSLREQQIVLSTEADPNFWTRTVGDEEIKLRIITDNQPTWETMDDPTDSSQLADPSNTANNHVGWYFDLPISAERMVSDVMIRDGTLIAVSFIPNQSPCCSGGDSIVHELSAASGGRLSGAGFDITQDNVINSQDLINIGDQENPLWAAPAGIKKMGRLQAPVILRMGNTEIKYFDSSTTDIKTLREKSLKLGIRHWREVQ